jgi:O-antigen/teichoic acid export membrane protein
MTETSSKQSLQLVASSLLVRNVVWNMFGTGAPLLVAFVSLPILITRIGKDRFGVLILAWALIGYASLFDLGLGRALTKLVSERIGTRREDEIPPLFWTTQAAMALLATAGASLAACCSPWLVHRVLKIPTEIQAESLHAFYALAFSMPFVISTAGLRGFLEAQQRFKLINLLRVPMGIFTFLGPLMALPFSSSIFYIVVVLVSGRLVGWGLHLLFCFRVMPALSTEIEVRPADLRQLFRLGGWMTVSNVVGPLMLYMDRFVIGGVISATAVTYYATPFEVVTKLLIISNAVSAVMFPAFSQSSVQDIHRSSILYRRTLGYTLVVLAPLTLGLMFGARVGLTFWLGQDFAAHSFRVAQYLLVGTFALGMGALPFAFVQGLGRPDIPAILNLVEIPFYAGVLYYLLQHFGVAGAAAAWMARSVIDTILLLFFSRKMIREPALRRSEVEVLASR